MLWNNNNDDNAIVRVVFQFGANLSGFAFLYIDLVLITSLSITCKDIMLIKKSYTKLGSDRIFFSIWYVTYLYFLVGYTEAYPILVAKFPQVSLLSIVPVLSIVVQITINFLIQLFVFFAVQSEPW